MTRSETSSFAEELSEKSKHWANYRANYMYYRPGSGKEQRASKAEDLFFYWLWRKGDD